MAPTVGSQNLFASKLGLDTAETNPVLLKKMARWKQSKHKQRILEARRGSKPKPGVEKVGVPFARSGFKKDKLPPVESRAHRDLLDESMGDLSASLDDLQAGAGRSTPERALQGYYEANPPNTQHVHQSHRRRHKPARHRRRPEPPQLSDRPEFDCTPLDNREDVSQSGLKIRREVATREPPRKPKQIRALEGISEQQPEHLNVDRDHDSAPSPSAESTSSASSGAEPTNTADLTKAQQTIAELRKLLHEEKQKTSSRVQEAQAAAREKTDTLTAALAQTKTQLRMLQKQLHKAREEATAAKTAADATSTVVVKRGASTAPDVGNAMAVGSIRRGFERIRLRPRSEQRARDASTPPSRIPEPRPLRTATVRVPIIEQVQAPVILADRNSSRSVQHEALGNDCTAEAESRPMTPSSEDAAPGEATTELDTTVESTPGEKIEDEVDVNEVEGEDPIRLQRGLSTSTSCSFCVTGSPPMAGDASAVDPPEAELVAKDDSAPDTSPDDFEGERRCERGHSEVESAGAAVTDVVELTDRVLDGVAKALVAIDTTSDNIRSETEAADAGHSGKSSADEWWYGCGPPTVVAPEEANTQDAQLEGEVAEEAEQPEEPEEVELPVEIVTR